MNPADQVLRCPNCGAHWWDRRGGEWTLRVAILKVRDGHLVGRCYESGCRGEAVVPFIALVEPAPAPDPAPAKRRRLIVRLTPALGAQ